MFLNVEKAFNLDSVDIFTNAAGDVTITISGTGGTFVINEPSVPYTGKTTPYTLYPDIFIPAGNYSISFVGTTAKVWVQVSDKSNHEIPGILEFGGQDGGNHYGLLYDWNISIPNSCNRTPVEAVIDPTHPDCEVTALDDSELENLRIYPNPTTDVLHLTQKVSYEVQDALGRSLQIGYGNLINVNSLESGTYFIKVSSKTYKIVKE